MIYPNSVPEFRVLVKASGEQVLQVRYVCAPQGYTGPWQNVPVVKEDEQSNQS